MKKTFRSIVAGTLGAAVLLTSGSALAAGSWKKSARMEEGRVLIQASGIGRDVYIAGGSTVTGPKATFELYDTMSDIWRPLPPMPAARERFGMGAFSGRIYISGGRSKALGDPSSSASKELWTFDSVSRDWIKRADMPTTRVDHSMVNIGNMLYVIGGTGPDAGKIYIYNIVEDVWSQSSAVMQVPRKGFGVASADGKIYIVGGVTLDGNISAEVNVFDTRQNVWTKMTSMPQARVGLAAAFIKGRLHIAGGSIPDPARVFNEHLTIEPGQHNWVIEPQLPTARHAMASAVIGDKWYIIGGGSAAGFYTLFAAADAVEVYAAD